MFNLYDFYGVHEEAQSSLACSPPVCVPPEVYVKWKAAEPMAFRKQTKQEGNASDKSHHQWTKPISSESYFIQILSYPTHFSWISISKFFDGHKEETASITITT